MSFNKTLNLKNASTNSNEKELIRTEADYEKALAERDKLQAELDRLTKKEMQDKHKLNTLKNRYKEQKRRSRNHRLIERGAILESLIPNAESYTNEQIKHIIKIAFGNLPGGLQGIHFPESLRDNS
ncbi:MAG: DUF3847 domain-containing protein [Oscillospiraceae bacterium]|nr:DUF3847 domain-containing protein [Oscillospiraceae bacterium]